MQKMRIWWLSGLHGFEPQTQPCVKQLRLRVVPLACTPRDTAPIITTDSITYCVGLVVTVEDIRKKFHGSEVRTIDFDGVAMMGI